MEYPEIDALSGEVDRPIWSVMIPTYNCDKLLGETLASVLTQDPGATQMQIQVVDDCSPEGNPEAVVKSLAANRVEFHRHEKNVGATENFNSCLRQARGHFVHILHGDDTVLPGFYRHLGRAFEEKPAVGAAFCRDLYMDEYSHWQRVRPLQRREAGILDNFLERIAVRQEIQFAAIVVRRDVYEKLGGFHPGLYHSADWEMWKRIAANYPIWYEPKPLACYRVFDDNDSSHLIRTGANIVDTRKCIEISRSYLPPKRAGDLSRKAMEHQAKYALILARRLTLRGDIAAAVAQIRESLKTHRSLRLSWIMAKIVVRIVIWWLNSTTQKLKRLFAKQTLESHN